MPLELRPMTPADVPAFARVAHDALSQAGMGLACHSRVAHPAYLAHRARRVEAALANPHATMVKVVDTDDDDRLVAGAHWEALEAGRDDAALAALREPYAVIPEEEARHGEAQRDFFGWLYNARARIVGKTPHYILHLLVTHPSHQGRGAGSLLLRWGFARADAAGLPVYIEATPAGLPVYVKAGFEPLESHTFDLAKYGLEGTDTHTFMVRRARTEG
ncbi:acyl-CoA N-acyltransferase [Phyllosticta citribraziliensis]|uniref:Acyl-CoA N-acyltransferase n=1 Tax=Phyllosticta citribraziliensis TaxID=989973 RepID=A0ABR1L9S9_9PEZI